MSINTNWKLFIVKIILPTLLAFLLFTTTIFTIIIPSFEENIIDRKKEMLKELTNSAWSVFDEFYKHENDSLLSRKEAQLEAITRILYLRYGNERKDYFWITDTIPTMIMHPYRNELNTKNLEEYVDPNGKKLFVECVNIVKDSGHGFVNYMWQWKDDSTKIVQKLSYVKEYKPWGWIIGTGIYLEDVAIEIAQIKERLIYISVAILLLLGLLLLLIAKQSLNIEKEKQTAVEGLRESEAKYRTLVEASKEGIIMILENKYVYANDIIYSLLGYCENEKNDFSIEQIIKRDNENQSDGQIYFNNLLSNTLVSKQIETILIKKDGSTINVIIFVSEIIFGKKKGFTVIIKDLSRQKYISEKLDETEEKFSNLTNIISIGVFRTTLGRKGKFIEANLSTIKLLGFRSEKELYGISVFDLIDNIIERKLFIRSLLENEFIKNYVLNITHQDGTLRTISVSAVLVKDGNGSLTYCDGIIEDITNRINFNEEREKLIVDLQTSIHFLNHTVNNYSKKIISCSMTTSINQAAILITKHNSNAILIKNEVEEYIGIVTDSDFRKRVITDKVEINNSITRIMTSPLIFINSNSPIFEAFFKMRQNSIHHLIIKENDKIVSIISSEELMRLQGDSSSYLLKQIENVESVEGLKESYSRLHLIIKTIVNTGAKTENITNIISSVSDLIINKLIILAFEEIGNPPCKFAFISFGSEGREEQTLITDQDNAIIFEDINNEDYESRNYFLKLGEIICSNLNDIGYDYCKGNNMANNPKWVQPLSEWKNYFSSWIINSTPEDLLRIGIFFDFRLAFGNSNLTTDLRDHIFKTIENKAPFFQHLTANCLLHKLPIGILGKILLKTSGEHQSTFDIKKAMMPIIDFARIYSLKYSIAETNTLERLNILLKLNKINKSTYNEIIQAYNFLMQIRIRHQVYSLSENNRPNNFINPILLTVIEQNTLRNTFTQISNIQKSLNYEFSGNVI